LLLQKKVSSSASINNSSSSSSSCSCSSTAWGGSSILFTCSALVWFLDHRSQMLVMRRESSHFQESTCGVYGYFQ